MLRIPVATSLYTLVAQGHAQLVAEAILFYTQMMARYGIQLMEHNLRASTSRAKMYIMGMVVGLLLGRATSMLAAAILFYTLVNLLLRNNNYIYKNNNYIYFI